jgi:hypothetical protein
MLNSLAAPGHGASDAAALEVERPGEDEATERRLARPDVDDALPL